MSAKHDPVKYAIWSALFTAETNLRESVRKADEHRAQMNLAETWVEKNTAQRDALRAALTDEDIAAFERPSSLFNHVTTTP